MTSTRAPGWDGVAAFVDARLGATWGAEGAASVVDLHPTDDVVVTVTDLREGLLGSARSRVTVLGAGSSRRWDPTRPVEGSLPLWSPDGSVVAHAVESGIRVGEYLREVEGFVERLAWSGDGRSLLLVVADGGSEMAGLAGSGLLPLEDPWAASVESTDGDERWRRLVVLDVATGRLSTVGRPGLNVWNACWAGDRILAVCSAGSSSESAWFTADLRLLDPSTGEDTVVAAPTTQVGPISASPSGRRVAWVQSICSDRDCVAGDLQLLDLDSGALRTLAAPTDVTDVAFVTDQELGFVGLEGMTTRLGFVSTDDVQRTLWTSTDSTAAGVLPRASFRVGRAAFVHVGPRRRPEVLLLTEGEEPAVVASLLPDDATAAFEQPGTSRLHRWTAPDGLEIEAWLHLPASEGPHPLVVLLHGGPVSSHRATWSPMGHLVPLLLARGYAVHQPNPRGSCGRGQAFASAVVGDMGGADATDITSGVEALVAEGTVDPTRVGVVGGSYGGFMSAWLVSRTDAFAAAVAQHPITDWTFQHGTSSLPLWDELFLDGRPYATDGQYVQRSPITHASSVRTPVLLIAGALDRATPPGQSLAMHRALAAQGVASECVTYPHAAHGPRDMPTTIDVLARTVGWFERWMPADRAARATDDEGIS